MVQVRFNGPQTNACGILSPSRRRAGRTASNQGKPQWMVFSQATHAESFVSALALGPFTETVTNLTLPKYH